MEISKQGTEKEEWATGTTIKSFKKGVCNQSVIAKIFDFIVSKQLQCMSSCIISEKQHSFVKNRSTLSNLIEYYSFLNDAFATKLQVDAAYTDFSKAFDKLNHKLLLLKLSKYGFNNNTIKWLASFLSDRQQQYMTDAMELQDDLNRLHAWSLSNLLPLNLKKCYVISFLNSKSLYGIHIIELTVIY
ncbi:uncharacterized protein LOC135138443 [Zophobas morio]|uniref:uncharacterized protein LOC135138443 n=1 Tax=Zophobas morio TaxID=2755281 RepID=UPI003083D472